MKAIVAVDLNWGIGCNGKLLKSIPDDMKFFKEKTTGNVVVMGRETLESFPGKVPLKNRVNIVLTRNEAFNDDRLTVCHSVAEALDALKQYDEESIFIIGGESIYKEFLEYCNEVYLTKIDAEYTADKYFPNLDKDPSWVLEEGEEKEHDGLRYRFNRYKRIG